MHDDLHKHVDSLKELFAHHSGDADARALRCLVSLCRAANLSTDDDYCRDKITAVEDLGAELFTHGGHRRFSVERLRQGIANALELLESRLYSLAARPLRMRSVPGIEIHPV